MAESGSARVSGMWSPVTGGSATLAADVVADRPFVGPHCQRVTFAGGTGEAGIANRGLNRCGLSLVSGRPYDGFLWVRGAAAAAVSLESRDGERRYATAPLGAPVGGSGGDWRRVDFTLVPDGSDAHGQFAIRLRSAGTLDVGYAFLQPGEWGRFKGLPVRGDVVRGLLDQGVTVLRHGGSMVNARGYRWKTMIGPRDRRPPYRGTWYRYSSNGRGVADFLDLCEAMNVVPVPDLNVNEMPADVVDFAEYANGPPDGPWGRRRAADGHPQPYGINHLELGNEERVDAAYAAQFAAIADAVWARDPKLILVVGDFEYVDPIAEADHLTGATSKITDMDGHRRVLDVARRRWATVWFDVHVWTERPPASRPMDAVPSYVDAIDRLAGDTKHATVVFELNANRHEMGRAVANAQAVVRCERDGRLPVVASANCLQPDGQNDNGWDQGLLFLNPGAVWLQPPGDLTQMLARSQEPDGIHCDVTGGPLKASAASSRDAATLVLHVGNPTDAPVATRLDVGEAIRPTHADVVQLSGPTDGRNTAADPRRVVPVHTAGPYDPSGYTFPPRSFTTLTLE